MTVTNVTYTGNGTTTLYSLPFPYLQESSVKVTVSGSLVTNYIFVNSTTIQFTVAPANGAQIIIYRETDVDEVEATFFAGSAIKAKDLNQNFKQSLYTLQELVTQALSKLGDTMQGILNMGGFKITNLGTPSSGTDAATKAYADLKVAKTGDTMSGNLDMGTNRVINLGVPQVDADSATKKYVDDRYGVLTVPGFTRWRKVATAGQTTFSGAGDFGGTLAYSSSREEVYINGVLQQRNVDYTANTGTSVVFTVGLIVGDVVEVVCVNNVGSGTPTDQSSGVYFTQSGSGAVTRTVDSKLKDVVSVKDFGAVGDGTDSRAAWLALVAAYPTNQVDCIIPAGTYGCSGASLTIPANIRLLFEKGATLANGHSLVLKSVVASNANNVQVKPAEVGLGYPGDQQSFNYLEVSGNSGSGGNVVAHNLDLVQSSQNVQSNAKGAYARYSEVRFGGAGTSGGFAGSGGFSYVTGATTVISGFASNAIGVSAYGANLGYSMGGSIGDYQGSVFGCNTYGRADSGATYLSNLTSLEANTELKTGASCAYKSGIQIVAADQVTAATHDCGLAISSKTGATAYRNGILVGDMNGGAPLLTSGSVLDLTGTWTTTNGIDLTGVTFTGHAYSSNLFRVDGNGNVSVGFISRVADAFAPLQLNAQPGESRGIMFDKAGAYGFYIGYDNNSAGRTEAVIRQITGDSLAIIVNNTTRSAVIKSSGVINLVGTPTYADNAAALAGGLVASDVYRNASGQLYVVI